jgi:hypothetical protein
MVPTLSRSREIPEDDITPHQHLVISSCLILSCPALYCPVLLTCDFGRIFVTPNQSQQSCRTSTLQTMLSSTRRERLSIQTPRPTTTCQNSPPPKQTEFATDLNHVAQLGLANAAELEKKVVRALDTWMMPQLWILYMFNYLNRTNIAQARLNSFNQDLNLGEGDYQVPLYQHLQSRAQTDSSQDRCCRPDGRLHAGTTTLKHAHHSCVP